ncbi:MAG: GtrA family protein [Prevotella sp.]|nr:GtrA family protein [Prevotella sp.]
MLNELFSRRTLGQVFRFAIVGTIAVIIHYSIYLLLQQWTYVNVAFTAGYIISFCCNYWLSAHFTFRKKTSASNGIGFAGAHLTNYLIQTALLNLFLWLGVAREYAPLCVFCFSVPINFLMVRFAFSRTPRHTTDDTSANTPADTNQ